MTTIEQTGQTSFTTPTERELVATRVMDAPARVVWEAWTNPKHIPHWILEPEKWTMPVCEIDLRPGGTWHFVWNDEGQSLEIRGVYREVKPFERLVGTEAWGGDWPETLNTQEFAEENGKTTMTCTMQYPTREARDRALANGMKEGLSISYDRLDAYLRTPEMKSLAFVEHPLAQHEWLQQLVGDWTFDTECQMGPDEPPMKASGSEHVRTLGGLWILAEGEGECPGGGPATTLMTLGYDAARQQFVGSWIGSMMSRQWIYEGQLDESGKVLALLSEGPSMQGDGTLAQYRDAIEIKDKNHRVLTSSVQTAEGGWQPFMSAHYRRTN